MAPAPDLDLLPRADTVQATSASSSSLNIPAIVGGTIAGLVLVGVLIVVVIVPRYRRRQLHKHQQLNLDPPWEVSSDNSYFKSYEPVSLKAAPRNHRHTDSSSSMAPLLGNTIGGLGSSPPDSRMTLGHHRPSSQIISSLPSLPYSPTSYAPIQPQLSREDEEDDNDGKLLRIAGYAHLQAPAPTRVATNAPLRDLGPHRDFDTTPRPINLQYPSPRRMFPISPSSEGSSTMFVAPTGYVWGQTEEPISLSMRDEFSDGSPPLHTPYISSRSTTPTPPASRHFPTPPVTPTPLKIDQSTTFKAPPPPPSLPPSFPLPAPPPPLSTAEGLRTPPSPLNFTYFSPSSESIDSASMYSQITPTDDGTGSFSRKASRKSKRSMSSGLRESTYPPPSSNPFDIPFDIDVDFDALASLAEHPDRRGRRENPHRLSTGTVRAERSVSLERMDTLAIGNLLKSRATASLVDPNKSDEDGVQESPVEAIERMGSIRGVGEKSVS
ncbi:hypothetical protein MD484_g6761, partial [Candolleomyces efflorescens]